MNTANSRMVVFRFALQSVLTSFLSLSSIAQDDIWGVDSWKSRYGRTGRSSIAQDDVWGGSSGTTVGYSKANPAELSKQYEKWIQTHRVYIQSDGRRLIVNHQHTDDCRRNGYCFLKKDSFEVDVESTNRIGRIISDTAKIRLASELDEKSRSWLVEVIDATALPYIQINPSAGNLDVAWIVVDFENLEDHELYDDRIIDTPLSRKKEARRIRVPSYQGSSTLVERKLPVFCDKSEVSDFLVRTNVVVETKTKVVETPIRYVKPTMQDFEQWIKEGNAVTYHIKFTDTCPACKSRGRWTEWQAGKQKIVTCNRCKGTGSIWIEKDVTVQGP